MVYIVGSTSASTFLAKSASAVWRFVRGAPITYLWLTALLITTTIQQELTHRQLHTLLLHRSTNLHHLGTDPIYVLFSSLFWIDGRYWSPYLVLFTLFLAPAEHWLGQIRWLTVGFTAHIAATYISEGVLYFEIQHHVVPERLVNARDIGVSYFLLGVMAVLAYHIAWPWRWGYLATVVLVMGVGLIVRPGFTAIGHMSALIIGLCYYPMARRRDGPQWDPARAWLRLRGSPARPQAS
jgi:hypothetical protein